LLDPDRGAPGSSTSVYSAFFGIALANTLTRPSVRYAAPPPFREFFAISRNPDCRMMPGMPGKI
jgi:hypothetical protein